MSPIALPFPLPHAKQNMKNYYYPAPKLSLIQGTPKHTVSLHMALRPNKPPSHPQSRKEKK